MIKLLAALPSLPLHTEHECPVLLLRVAMAEHVPDAGGRAAARPGALACLEAALLGGGERARHLDLVEHIAPVLRRA